MRLLGVPLMTVFSLPTGDLLFLGLTFLLLLASWGLILVCDRLMEGSK